MKLHLGVHNKAINDDTPWNVLVINGLLKDHM